MPKKLASQLKKRKIVLWPIFIVCIFAFLRVLLYHKLPGLEFYLGYDDAIYAMLSQKFVNGDFNSAFNPYWNSGFPLATIPFYLITHSWEASQILVSIVSHVLLILVMYLTLRKISLSLALVTSFFAAFSPSFVKLVTAGGVTEPFYVLLFWLAVYFGWQAIITEPKKTAGFKSADELDSDMSFSFRGETPRSERGENVITRKINHHAFAGLFFGLAYLTRTEIIYTLSIFLTFSVLTFFLKPRTFPSFNKITLVALSGGFLAYLFIPLTRLSKFSTFKFMIFRSTRGILFALPFAIIALLSVFFERNKTPLIGGMKKLIPNLLILLMVFLLVNLPYIVIVSKNLGHLTLSGKYAYIGSSHPFTPEKDRITTWAQDIWSLDFPNYKSPYYDSSKTLPIIWKYLDGALEATWKKMNTDINFFAHDNVFTDFEATLILLGFIFAILQKKFRKFVFYLFILWLGSFALVSHFMDPAARYFAFSFPLFYIAQGFAVISVGNLLSRIRPVLLPLTISVFTFWYFDKNVDVKDFTSIHRTTSYSDQKMIADYLKSQGIGLVMARTEGIPFYSGAKLIYMPAANPETIIKFAKTWGIEYLVVRPNEASWDYMRAIAKPNFKDPNLELIHQFDERTLIWKVKLTESEKLHNFRTDKDVNEKLEDVNINSQTIIK